MTAPHDAGGSNGNVREATDFSIYHGKRLALVLSGPGGKIVAVRGRACYTRDARLGSVLRLTPDKKSEGQPVFVIAEADWQGRIYPDRRCGCDFCFDTSR